MTNYVYKKVCGKVHKPNPFITLCDSVERLPEKIWSSGLNRIILLLLTYIYEKKRTVHKLKGCASCKAVYELLGWGVLVLRGPHPTMYTKSLHFPRISRLTNVEVFEAKVQFTPINSKYKRPSRYFT